MTAVRLVYTITDPFLDARQPIAALVAVASGEGRLVPAEAHAPLRAAAPQLPLFPQDVRP